MKVIYFYHKSLEQRINIIKTYDTGFIITLLKLAERDGRNRDNDEDFLLLDHELERRVRQNIIITY
jgi:hypothetical protein